jgi:hypothetical protein
MTEVLKASTSNWIWLANLKRHDRAVVVGDRSQHLRTDLTRHFKNVVWVRDLSLDGDSQPKADADGLGWVATSARRLPIASGSVDCLCLDSRLVLDQPAQSTNDDILIEARRIVNEAGCLFLPREQGDARSWLKPWRLDRISSRLRLAGFRRIRTYYVFPDHGYFDSIIPAEGRAAAGYVVWGEGATRRGRLRRLATLAGAHRMTYKSWFYLAYP